MTSEQIDSLATFLIQDQTGLESIFDLAVAKEGLRCAIAMRKEIPDFWMDRIDHAHPEFRDDLYGVLVGSYNSVSEAVTFLSAFLERTFDLDSRTWFCYSGFKQETFRQICSSAEVFKRMLRYRTQAILNPHNPFFGLFETDLYWQEKVRRSLSQKKFASALDVILQASKGVTVGRVHDQTKTKFCYRASHELILSLVAEIYHSLRKNYEVPLVADNVYLVKLSADAEDREEQIPSFWFIAKHFLLAQGYPKSTRFYMFSRLGAMAIAVATYHRKICLVHEKKRGASV